MRLRPDPRCRLHAATALAIALLSSASCSAPSDAPGSTHEFVVTEEDGVAVARSTGGPKYAEELFEYERVLEIRLDPSKPETVFYRGFPSALDQNGNVYVVDSSAHRIAVFDDSGEWLRDIGREGQGPGEFQYPSRVSIVDGRVHVTDYRRRASHVFELDGQFVDMLHWPDLPRVGSMVPEVWWTETGGAVVRLLNEPRDDRTQARAEMVVTDEEGSELARTASPWVWTGEILWQDVGGQRRGTALFAHYSAQPWGGYVPGKGMWMTTGELPIVWWHDLQGNEIGRWEVDLPIVAVSAEDRAEVEAILAQQLAEALEPPPPGQEKPSPHMIQARAANPLFAENHPVWGIPGTDDRGYFWIPEEPPAGFASQPRSENVRTIVLSPEGEFLGYTTPPGRGYITRGHLLTSDTDPETEEPYPVVYRIRPAVDGLELR